MEFEKQKPVTEQYRENWEHVFGQRDNPPLSSLVFDFTTGRFRVYCDESLLRTEIHLQTERQSLKLVNIGVPEGI